MTAAIVKLNALTDSVWPGTQDHHLLLRGCARFVVVFIGGVKIRRERLELRATGVDPLENRSDIRFDPCVANFVLCRSENCRQPLIGEAHPLRLSQFRW